MPNPLGEGLGNKTTSRPIRAAGPVAHARRQLPYYRDLLDLDECPDHLLKTRVAPGSLQMRQQLPDHFGQLGAGFVATSCRTIA